MSISLNKPAQGTPNWATLINSNWTTIENCFNGGEEIGPLDCGAGQINNLQVENVLSLPGEPHVPGRLVYLTTDNTLYFNNGTTWGTIGGGGGAHNILSHADAISATPTIGDLLTYQSGGWGRLPLGTAGKLARSDGTNVQWSTFAISNTFAQGSIVYASGANSLGALTIGTANNFLQSNGTIPLWYDLFGSANSWVASQAFTGGLNVTAGQNIDLAGGSGAYFITRNPSGDIEFYTNTTLKFIITYLGNIICGYQAALDTTAESGFLYIPASAGTPTGSINTYTGKIGFEYDTTNRLPYFNDANAINPWRFAQLGNSATLTDGDPVTLTVTNAYLYLLTATVNETINASAGGIAGQRIAVAVQSNAAVARTITFGTNFRPNGTLTTPAIASKYVIAGFVSNGTSWLEEYRQTGGI